MSYQMPWVNLRPDWNTNPVACHLCGEPDLFCTEYLDKDRYVHSQDYGNCKGEKFANPVMGQPAVGAVNPVNIAERMEKVLATLERIEGKVDGLLTGKG